VRGARAEAGCRDPRYRTWSRPGTEKRDGTNNGWIQWSRLINLKLFYWVKEQREKRKKSAPVFTPNIRSWNGRRQRMPLASHHPAISHR